MAIARVATITLKTDRPREVSRFWRDLLAYRVAPNHSNSVLLIGDGPAILVQPSGQAVNQGAIHLDLRPDDQAKVIERALELGASRSEIGQNGDEGWVVMRDPGGNLFCVLQSQESYESGLGANPGYPTPID